MFRHCDHLVVLPDLISCGNLCFDFIVHHRVLFYADRAASYFCHAHATAATTSVATTQIIPSSTPFVQGGLQFVPCFVVVVHFEQQCSLVPIAFAAIVFGRFEIRAASFGAALA